ncbi:MAG: saccharopine dehydrogenase NADP-binding domain-containing protein [Solirubrobacteraceae bacterium]
MSAAMIARERPRIAVYGATGFTGRQVAEHLTTLGDCEPVLVGRDRVALADIARDCAGARVAVATLDDQSSLRRAFEGCRAVIGCAGPFRRYGEPVARAAVAAGTHYLDISGEQAYILRLFDALGAMAAAADVALIPALGIDCVPGDMLAALAADGLEPLEHVTIAVDIHGERNNRGSLVTLLDIAHHRESVRYVGGELRPAEHRVRAGHWTFSDGLRARMMRFPGAEIVLVPRHLDVGRVEVSFTSRSALPRHAPPGIGIPAMATVEWVARTPLYRLVRSLMQRLPAPSGDIPYVTIECEARNGERARRFRLTASGAYHFTAVAVCEAARRVAAPEFHLAGPLSPAQAFDPATFLNTLAGHGCHYAEVTSPPPPGPP